MTANALTDLFCSTSKELTASFNEALAELRMTPADLAKHMHTNGDYRDFSATLRSIQRMISGDTRVSGEMLVIIKMLLRQRRRLQSKYSDLQWHRNERGIYKAEIDGWFVHIAPQTKGRWLLHCRHGKNSEDYSPPFGRWLDSLDEAKEKALICVEEGMNDEAESSY